MMLRGDGLDRKEFVPEGDMKSPPEWVIEHMAGPFYRPDLFGPELVLRDINGVVIDRWPDAPEGFWRDAGQGVQQWVVPE